MHPKTDGGAETCAYRRPILVCRALPGLLAIVLSACGGGDAGDGTAGAPSAAQTPSATPAGTAVALGCESVVPSPAVKTPRGLVVPDGPRVVTGVTRKRPDDERITVVEGYVEQLPGDLVKAFEAQKGVRVLFKEDEGFEAELLVSDGRHRAFWKVVRACPAGSRFTALYSAERSGDAVAGAAPPTKSPIKRR
jgi:hypothetical protein